MGLRATQSCAMVRIVSTSCSLYRTILIVCVMRAATRDQVHIKHVSFRLNSQEGLAWRDRPAHAIPMFVAMSHSPPQIPGYLSRSNRCLPALQPCKPCTLNSASAVASRARHCQRHLEHSHTPAARQPSEPIATGRGRCPSGEREGGGERESCPSGAKRPTARIGDVLRGAAES